MTKQNPFSGKIQVFANSRNKSPKGQVSFQIDPGEAEISQALMSEFHDLDFSREEKRELTRKHREQIHKYRNLSLNHIKRYSNQLISEIKKHPEDQLVVKAGEAGAYICLAAIFSGKLPSHKQISFELNTVPLGLFPKQLAKVSSPGDFVELKFQWKQDSWLKPFQSLKTCPSFISLPHKQGEEEYELNAA